jgi:hypothetical protein
VNCEDSSGPIVDVLIEIVVPAGGDAVGAAGVRIDNEVKRANPWRPHGKLALNR